MRQLIDAGYVYIAKPPLYRVKSGRQEVYIEKESELEELLLREKLDDVSITDSQAKQHSLTAARWQRFNRRLKEYDGWSESLRAEFGHGIVDFLSESRILDEGAATLAGAKKIMEANDPEGDGYETALIESSDEALQIRAVHRKSGLARVHTLPATLFGSTEYRHLVEVHADLLKQVGSPPFEVHLGDRHKSAETFGALRHAVLDLSRHGVALQRFKGLGEMNADQLRETTMDPGTRTLQRVTIDDAALAETELMFTDLMGDKVEPRKVFIEKHAKEVGFLDV
jgi:DNA gyrase subunit B